MGNALFRHILLLSLLLSLISCNIGSDNVSEEGGDTLQLKYSKLLHITRFDDHITVSVDDPWNAGHILHKYILVERDKPIPNGLPKGTIIPIPTKRNVVFNTAHCQLMEWLGVEDQICGVADLKYILIPSVKERVKSGVIADCGEGMSPVVEKIIDLKPDMIMLSPFENSGGYGRLDGIGIPLMECADYMEPSALARAEWMRFYGILFGCEQEADSLFALIDSSYQALKLTARQSNVKRSIITEKLTGSTWYVPGGASTVGGLISDANGTYAWSGDTHSGSLSMTFETVLDKAGNSDVWIFNHFGSGDLTYERLGNEYAGYHEMKAFKSHNAWYVDSQRVPYFEEVSFRPDYLLRDYIILLHPELNLGTPKYYRPVITSK